MSEAREARKALTKERQQEQMETVLIELTKHNNVTRAAEIAGVSEPTLFRWRKENPAFAEAWHEARILGAELKFEVLEQEAIRRSVEGVEKPVSYKGEVCGHVREYSDTILMFLMQGARPDKYRNRTQAQLLGEDGQKPVQVNINIGFANGGPGQGNSKPPIEHKKTKPDISEMREALAQQVRPFARDENGN